MDIPDKKAGSMDPVTVAKKTPRPDHVRAGALFAACVTAFSIAGGYSVGQALARDPFHVTCSQVFLTPCDHLTDAEEVAVELAVNAIWCGMLSSAPVLAAWALLVVRLPCRRPWVRRALAWLALAVAIVGYCLYATAACLLLVAHPGELFLPIFWIVVIFVQAMTSPFSFSVLRGDEEE